MGNINTADIVPGYKTDHSMITMEITTNFNPRGPGLWKLNTSFLSEDNYVSKIKDIFNKQKMNMRMILMLAPLSYGK